jgi:hypothetical protein
MMASGENRFSPTMSCQMPVLAQSQNGNGGAVGAFVAPAATAVEGTTLAEIVVTAVSMAAEALPGVLLPDSTSSNDTTSNQSYIFHFTTDANRARIEASGFILPGASGVAYVSPSPYTTAGSAQSQLALPTTPNGYFVIPNQNLPGPLTWSVVTPNFGFPGGGFEGTTPLPIPIGGATWVPFHQ